VNEIIFRQAAFDQMDEIIRNNPSRVAEFATALQQMTAALRGSADATGESRDSLYRVAFFGELTFHFRPAPDEGRVYVVNVRLRHSR
jgi:hypothetical protein